MSLPLPEIERWYQTPAGDRFEVIAFDAGADAIEVQYYDGTIEEYDADSWAELSPARAEAPEDWTGSLDVAGDDYGVDLDRPAGDSHENLFDAVELEHYD